jgi:hypothetical protein
LTNCVNDFEPSFLVVQQTEIYYDVRLEPGPHHPGNDIDTFFRPLVEDLKVLWNNNGVKVWDKNKREYFQLQAILFVIVCDSPAARNLSGQRRK